MCRFSSKIVFLKKIFSLKFKSIKPNEKTLWQKIPDLVETLICTTNAYFIENCVYITFRSYRYIFFVILVHMSRFWTPEQLTWVKYGLVGFAIKVSFIQKNGYNPCIAMGTFSLGNLFVLEKTLLIFKANVTFLILRIMLSEISGIS